MRSSTIFPHTTLSAVIAMHPSTLRIFHELGMDACCGGMKSLEEAAAAHRVDLPALLESIDQCVAGGGGETEAFE